MLVTQHLVCELGHRNRKYHHCGRLGEGGSQCKLGVQPYALPHCLLGVSILARDLSLPFAYVVVQVVIWSMYFPIEYLYSTTCFPDHPLGFHDGHHVVSLCARLQLAMGLSPCSVECSQCGIHATMSHWCRESPWEYLAVQLTRESEQGDPDLFGMLYFNGMNHVRSLPPWL